MAPPLTHRARRLAAACLCGSSLVAFASAQNADLPSVDVPMPWDSGSVRVPISSSGPRTSARPRS